MAYATIRSTLFDHLRTNWTTNATTLRTPVAVTNVKELLTRVDGTQPIAAPPVNSPWLRFNVVGLNDKPTDLGRTQHMDVTGIVALQVFTPVGSGTTAGDTYIDLLRDLYERKSFDLGGNCRLQCRYADPPTEGFETAQWWQRNLWIPFRASEARAIPA